MTSRNNSLDGEGLGRSLRWTRALVAQLVGEAGIEDVTQDVWLAATKSRGSSWPPSRSWLAGTARRLAARWWRDTSRGPGLTTGRDLDQLVDPLGTEQLVERNEEHQRIARLVLTLEEPMRQAVLLRFQESLDVNAIAARQQVSADTVRWRLRRGLELLRAQLDRERGPGWQAGLVVLMGSPPKKAMALKTTTPLWAKLAVPIGGVLLSAKLIAGVLIITALMASYLALPEAEPTQEEASNTGLALATSSEATPPSSPSLASPGDTTRSALGTSSAALDQGPASLDPPILDPAITCTLVGQVVDDKQRPIAGATVAFDYPDDLPGTTSDGDGNFRLVLERVPESDAGLIVTPDLYHQIAQIDFEFGGSTQPGQALRALHPGTVDLGAITLGPAGAVQGRVMGRDNMGLVSSRVRVQPVQGEDADVQVQHEQGDYVLGHLAPGEAQIKATMDGFLPAATKLNLLASQTVHQDLVLELGPTISGTVVDQAGRPMPGVTAYKFLAGSRDQPTVTDENGHFSLGFSSNRSAHLKFSKLGWESVDPMSRRVSMGTRDLVVVMAPVAEISFHVVDGKTLAPLAPYSLEVYLQTGEDGDSSRADWHLEGLDVQRGLSGLHRNFGRELVDAVLVRSDGYTGVYRTIHFDEGTPGVMTIALKPEAFHRGRVTWQGKPVPGARVELARQRSLYHYEFVEYQGRITSGPSSEERAALAKLHATDLGGLMGATLHLLDSSERSYQIGMTSPEIAFTDDAGYFELQDWSGGRPHSLMVTPPTSALGPGPLWTETVPMEKDGPTDFGDIALPPATSVSGWVQPKGQASLQGHTLSLLGAVPSSVITDAQGFFKFDRVPPGSRELTLEPSREDGLRAVYFRLEVHAGVDRELQLPLSFPD